MLAACSNGHAKQQPAPLAVATPFAAPTLPCDHDAMVLDQATPEFPDELRGKVHEAQVAIAVDISANGRPRHTRVVQSSGFPALDAAGLIAADKSTYLPAARHCKPVPGTFTFRVTYSTND